jgi:hypothetical protein
MKIILELLKVLVRVKSSLWAALFAHAVVPVVAVLAAAYLGAPGSPLLTATGSVSAVSLATQIDASGGTIGRPGVGLVVQPEHTDVTLTMATDIRAIRTSLSPSECRANRSRVEINREVIVLHPPFSYVTQPSLFIIDGAVSPLVGIPGGSVALRDIALPARHSPVLVVALMVVVAFSIGLAFAASDVAILAEFVRALAAAEE